MNVQSRVLEYGTKVVHNRQIFLLNFKEPVMAFDRILDEFREVWGLVATTRDVQGRSHVGLLRLVVLAQRHMLIGFNNFASYQSYMGWLAFRPALEALLFAGVWADDPSRADIWRNWREDKQAYRRLFSSKSLGASSFPRAKELGKVLSRLNDRFAHPNPLFAKDALVIQQGEDMVDLSSQFFDPAPHHLPQLLAFLSLVEVLLVSSYEFIRTGIVISGAPDAPTRRVPKTFKELALQAVADNNEAREVLDDMGLWDWGESNVG